MDMTSTADTLVDLLIQRAEVGPFGSFTFLKDGINEQGTFTYARLDYMARAVAVTLLNSETRPQQGDRIMLLYPPGVEFLVGFFGCLYAGLVPIPAPPPDVARLKRTLPRLLAILDDADSQLILTTEAIRQNGRMADASEGRDIEWLTHETIDPAGGADWIAPNVGPADLAYLQYTSGSTGSPKGVMLTHGNVMHNLELLRKGFVYSRESVSVTWMPYFHDYGLVDGLLEPLYVGIPSYIMSPLTFIKRPLRWLEAIHQYRGTHTQAPNFAYELCLEKIKPEQRDALDLSSLKSASNGAEPVRSSTLIRFSDFFGACGLKREALCPSYGLAEATLFVSAKSPGMISNVSNVTSDSIEREVVSCGPPSASTKVAIVDQTNRNRLPDGETGEIWISDPSVAVGYWNKPDESAETFGARISSELEPSDYLRTGDLGFMLGGELYVTGRTKDLIIVDGVNHYPQDIERTACKNSDELRPDHCAAFSVVSEGQERLVIVAELSRPLNEWQPLFNRLRRSVAETHDLELYACAILRRGSILKTSSGKLQRRGCRSAWLFGELDVLASWQKPIVESHAITAAEQARRGPGRYYIEEWLKNALSNHVGIPSGRLDYTAPFASLGLTSRLAVQFVGELEQWLDCEELSPTLLWEYSTVKALSAYLSCEDIPRDKAEANSNSAGEAIAIIGMASRLPAADTLDEFWCMLKEKGDGIRQLPLGRWDGTGFDVKVGHEPGNVATLKGGFLSDVSTFDADLFGIGGREAQIMDPQQRILLEVAWEALEDAGLAAERLAGSDSGVYVGISTDDYSVLQFGDPDAISAYTGPAKSFAIAANRISYHFDFHGPSLAIDTACSSSLVALHQAVQALRRGECSMALAGGVNLILSPQVSIALSQAGMLSPDARCNTFDAKANGYVRGEGCGILVLKRLSDAERDGDSIRAVVRGSAVNQDGRSNGLTAPNGLAQQSVVQAALVDAGVTASQIKYVETHGTGTALGDPIEVKSLQAVLGKGRSADESCALGAVKANIGHLESAAGIAGVIKTVLALQHEEIPPHPSLQSLNPLIQLEGTPFHVPTSAMPWPSGRKIAGVSSFGFGGTNAHIILEEVQPLGPPIKQEIISCHLLTLSARCDSGLEALRKSWMKKIALLEPGDKYLEDLCYSANTGRTRLPSRIAVSGSSIQELREGLANPDADRRVGNQPRIGFLFTGQGAQYAGMGLQLYRTEASFRQDIDLCDKLLRPHLDVPLRQLLFDAESEATNARLACTKYTQPVMFAVSYALARLWSFWGIKPIALAGHSIGEYAAACFAGVFSLADALPIVAARARLMQDCPGDGGMLSVNANFETVSSTILGTEVVIAAHNAPARHVLSGPRVALVKLAADFAVHGIETQTLSVGHAFHSQLMEPALPGLAKVFEHVTMSSPELPIYSNVTGSQVGLEMASASYWLDQLRKPVLFADAVRAMQADGIDTLIEVGPRPALLSLASQIDDDNNFLLLPSLRPRTTDLKQMMDSLGKLYLDGADFDPDAFHANRPGRRVSIPTYPFQRKNYWLPAVKNTKCDETSSMPGRMVSSPLFSQVLFELKYDTIHFSIWGDHRVFGQIVVPGAGHLSLVVEAAVELSGAKVGEARDIIFPKAMTMLQNVARRVQMVVDENKSFSVISISDEGSDKWVEHATGHIFKDDVEAEPIVPLVLLKEECAVPIGKPFYENFWQESIALGPRFRWVADIWISAGSTEQVLVKLKRPSEASADRYILHPGLLDSMLQALTVLVPVEPNEAIVPFRVNSIRWTQPAIDEELWSHLSIRSTTNDEIISDATLYTEDGTPCVIIEGIYARRIGIENLLPANSRISEEAIYTQLWHEVEPSEIVPHETLICSLEDVGGDSIVADTTTVLQRVLLTLQDAMAKKASGLVLVTRQAQSVQTDDNPSPAQASAWGLARTIRLEYPQLDCRCVDLDKVSEVSSLPWITDEPDLVQRGGKVFAPRLVRKMAPSLPPKLRADATYLISGGLGGLGLSLADGLVELGAKHLVLVGRSPPNAAATQRLAEMSQDGVKVRVVTQDISCIKRDQIEGDMPLAGVFHLAGILEDRTLLQLNPDVEEEFLNVLSPKLGGAVALHKITANLKLDYFVCFSSVAGVTGSMGQGVYAAANAAVDALVTLRRTKGLCGLSLQWGPWADVGMAAKQKKSDRKRLIDYGITPIGITEGIEVTGRLIATEGISMILPVRWQHFVSGVHSGVVPAIYRNLMADPVDDHAPSPNSVAPAGLLDRVAAEPPEQRLVILNREIACIVAAMLGESDWKKIGPRERFFEIGLDSLGAVEMRNRLSALIGKPLRATLLFDFPTLEALCEHIAEDVLGWTKEPDLPEVGSAALNDLSQDELANLLSAELGLSELRHE